MIALTLLTGAVGGVWWTLIRRPATVEWSSDPELMRAQLHRTIEQTYQRHLEQADQLSGWEQREKAREQAGRSRDRQMRSVRLQPGSQRSEYERAARAEVGIRTRISAGP